MLDLTPTYADGGEAPYNKWDSHMVKVLNGYQFLELLMLILIILVGVQDEQVWAHKCYYQLMKCLHVEKEGIQ